MGRVISNLTKIFLDENTRKLSLDGNGVLAPPTIDDLSPASHVIRESYTLLTVNDGVGFEGVLTINGARYHEWYDGQPITIWSREDPYIYASGTIVSYDHPYDANTGELTVDFTDVAGDGAAHNDWCVGTILSPGDMFVNSATNSLDIVVESGEFMTVEARTALNLPLAVVKIGNTATSTFLSRLGGSIEGEVSLDRAGFAVGTAATPSIFFTGSDSTGFYSPASDSIGVSVDGAALVEFSVDGVDLFGDLTSTGNIVSENVYATEGYFDTLYLDDVTIERTDDYQITIFGADPVNVVVDGTISAVMVGIGDNSNILESTNGKLAVTYEGNPKLLIGDEVEVIDDLRVSGSVVFDDAAITQTGSSQLMVTLNGIPKFEIGATRATFYNPVAANSGLIMGAHRVVPSSSSLLIRVLNQPHIDMSGTRTRFFKEVELDQSLSFDDAKIEQVASSDLEFSLNGFPKLNIRATATEVTGDLQVSGKIERDLAVDEFNGDDTTGPYPLTFTPLHKNNILVHTGTEILRPSQYTISGSSISFTTAKSASVQICVREI